MVMNPDVLAAARERLSALADGELDDAAVAQACAHWRDSAQSRASWHAYQLIGDVLRSDDLAGDAARDARFLASLRVRLASEPVVLAPQALERPLPTGLAATSPLRRWSWMAPAVVAAGFGAVAGVLTLTRISGVLPGQPAPALAQAGPGTVLPASALVGPSSVPAPEPLAFVASGQVIRDARLDRYLAAHKQFAGSTALGLPSGFLRNATVEAAGR